MLCCDWSRACRRLDIFGLRYFGRCENCIDNERSVNLKSNSFWESIAQRVTDFLQISALASKMGQIPSSIYSCSIGHIWEHEFCHLGSLGRIRKFLKRRNFCFSMLLFEVVFSTFYRQKKKISTFKTFFSTTKTWKNHPKKLHT